MIESCSNTDAHPEHYWQPNPNLRMSAWCPGATAPPEPYKPKYVVTIHSGHGSMVEAANPIRAFSVGDQQGAEALAERINRLFMQQGEGDYWASYLVTQEVYQVGPGSSAKTLQDLATMGPLQPGQVAIDVERIVDEILNDN